MNILILDNYIVDILRLVFLGYWTCITSIKITNTTVDKRNSKLVIILLSSISTVTDVLIKDKFSFSLSIIVFVMLISIIFSIVTKNKIEYSILVTVISFSMNCIIFIISITCAYLLCNLLYIQDNMVELLIIILIYIIFVNRFLKIKKLKGGMLFLQNKTINEFLVLLILNISVAIIFFVIILESDNQAEILGLEIGFIIFAIVMFLTIKKSFQLYYKQKLLIKDLDETKAELDRKNKEIAKLEKENLEISKKRHSLVQKQNALEFKINELLENNNNYQITLAKNQLEKISEQLYEEKEEVKLAKTEIDIIDNMLEYMQSECKKNKIDFELQICGNIHYMVNNLIEEQDLEILLADHIKNAIIAINHSDNINKSILVRIGKIDNIYSLYIYDSGIEFEKETLKILGKKPCSTHLDEGGSGIGFMNTFNTLKKCKASLIINEKGIPSKDDYTKVIIIKFDQKDEFKIISYKDTKSY